MNPLFFLYHLPKTGGQTIRDHLDRHLERDVDFLHLGRWDRGHTLEFEDVAALDAPARARLRSIGGHPLTREFTTLFPNRPIREVLFVREPAARIVSHYNFRATQNGLAGKAIPTLDGFLETVAPNPACTFVARALGVPVGPSTLSAVLYELTNLWMVGTTDRMDTLAPKLFGAMGLAEEVPARSNMSGHSIERHAVLTPDLADELAERHPLDVGLYAACCRLEKAAMNRLGIRSEDEPDRPLEFVPQ